MRKIRLPGSNSRPNVSPNITRHTVIHKLKRVLIIYDDSAIEPYENRGLGKKKDVEEKPTVVLYTNNTFPQCGQCQHSSPEWSSR